MTRLTRAVLLLALMSPTCLLGQESKEAPSSSYEYVGVTQRWSELKAPYDIVSTKDSKFFYLSSYSNGGIGIFKRDNKSGAIKCLEVFSGRKGMIHLDLNSDETRAVGCAYEGGLYLFERDPDDGGLKEIFHLPNSKENKNGLAEPMSLVLSPDGRFAYVVDQTRSALFVFEITHDDKIVFLQKHDGFKDCLEKARLLTMDSKGNLLFVAARAKGTLTVFDRDPDAGHVRMLSSVADQQDGITKLGGAHGVAISPDDRFVYVVCGRFGGDDSVCVSEIGEKKKLKLVQEWEAPEAKPFRGGSHIGISPDGKQLIATAWTTTNIAHFSRDSKTGKIEFKSYLTYKDKVQVGKTTQPNFSPDGKFLNLGSYSGNVLTYKRKDVGE